MMWKITGSGGRWASMAGNRFDCDERTLAGIDALTGSALPVTPVGPAYEATGTADPTWLYLAARRVLPGELELTGTPPELPTGPVDAGVDY